MRRFAVLLVIALVLPLAAVEVPAPPVLEPGADDVVEHDDWLHGTMNGQPLANMHVVTVAHPDGTRTTLSRSSVLLKRALLGSAITFAVEETNRYREDEEGYLERFQLCQEENGIRTSATGVVDGDVVRVSVHRRVGSYDTEIPLPDGVRLMGMEASQRALAEGEQGVGESRDFHVVGLMSGKVHLMTMTATKTDDLGEGRGRYRLVLDRVPMMPMHAAVEADGDIAELTMNFGPMSMRFVPAEGPQPLTGAELAMAGVVEMAGPPPKAADRNRYRLPEQALELLPQDGFQQLDENGVLTVEAQARPEALADPAPWLKRETNLEIDDPELVAWVEAALEGADEDTAERARILTQAVRDHLDGDLSRGEASALEAFHERKGDCTEHAGLLAAALRIAGLPSRVEVGFVYAGMFGGWGGHAWTSGYDAEAGRWLHLDAAYPGVPRSCYIKTGSGSNAEQGGTNAMLDKGMGLVMGQTIEVLPE